MYKKCEHGKAKTKCKQCYGGAICEHDRLRSSCRICSPYNFCEHNKRKGACVKCGGGNVCKHRKQKQVCAECGGGSLCKLHGKQLRSCRECDPRAWAVRLLSAHRQHAKNNEYLPPNITPEQLLKLVKESKQCCGCEGLIYFEKRAGLQAPCLHHNHKTGEVVGFAHRECNALEGQLQKLGSRLPTFLKNFFPAQIA